MANPDDTIMVVEEHVEPKVIVNNFGEQSQLTQSGNLSSNKRPNQSPPVQEHNKRYVFDSDSLVKQNKYYLPSSSEQTLTVSNKDIPVNKIPEEPKPPRIPPIFVHDAVNYQQLITDIKSKITGEFVTGIRGSQIKISLSKIEDHRNLTSYFDNEKNVKYHTYHDPESANISIIIRNLPISLTNDELLKELVNMKYPVTSVTRLLNREKNLFQFVQLF